MRLLSVHSLQLEMFHDVEDAPHYAILSHTWGEEEVTLQDLQRGDVAGMKGYKKIRGSCALAKSDGLDYVWIDTCCIDKTNSTELSEAINSMFRWYQYAKICYAYLNDVTRQSAHSEENYTVLDNCRWFTRGWTLQEIIAPTNVVFYDRSWECMGRRKDFASQISRLTSIDQDLLQGGDEPVEWRLSSFSVAKRLSWAARRKTTRAEDLAYCLMGIFDIHMPLIYGEGLKKAFQRLQAEILRNHNDQSILAWSLQHHAINFRIYDGWEIIKVQSSQEDGVFASHPEHFQSCGNIAAIVPFETPLNLSSGGLELQLKIFCNIDENKVVYGALACHLEDDFFHCIAIPLSRQVSISKEKGPKSFLRLAGMSLVRIPLEKFQVRMWTPVRLVTKAVEHLRNVPQHVILEIDNLRTKGRWTVAAAPGNRWNGSTLTMQFRHVHSEQKQGAFALEGTLSNGQPTSLMMLFLCEPGIGPRLLLRQGLSGGLPLLPQLAQHFEELESGTLGTDWRTDDIYIAPDVFRARLQAENRLGKAIWVIRVEWIRPSRGMKMIKHSVFGN